MDPVTLAVVRGALNQIADEMDLHLIRSAISPIISEGNDCANGLFHPESGETISQGQLGLPVFLANMQLTVQRVIELAKRDGGFKPGDVWMVNDPYFSGTHLPDICMVAPYFKDGRLLALMASEGHMLDIGGGQPGGWSPSATEIHQEGLIIPPLKLFEGGKRNEAVVKIILANLRLPDEVGGDIVAMTNVFSVASKRLEVLTTRYGFDAVASCIDEIMLRSERQMRSYIEEFPDGVYEFEDFLDNDGLVDEPIVFKLKITVRGSDLEFDFTGSSPAPAGPMNLARTTTISTCYIVLKHLFPDVPVNGGTFRPTSFVIPEGSVLDARYPKPVGGYLEMVGRVIDLVLGALSKAVPERTPAAFFGTTGIVTLGGVHPETGRYFVGGFPYCGGYGGSKLTDGLVHGVSPQSMARFPSLELIEHRYPIRVRSMTLREDSGGAGWHRGGCGTTFSIEATSDVVVSVLGDRVDHRPFGILGGKEAAANDIHFDLGGKRWVPPMRSKVQGLVLHDGDSLTTSAPGGGGYGDPLDRPAEDLQQDLNLGYVSAASAEAVYGAVIGKVRDVAGRTIYELDLGATERHRAQLRTLRKAKDDGGQGKAATKTAVRRPA